MPFHEPGVHGIFVRESSRYIPIDRKLFDRCRLP
jgi:hypothetical protein